MKLAQLVENSNRSLSSEEALDTFMDRVKGLSVSSQQSLARELLDIELDDRFDQSSAKFPNPEDIKDSRVLLGMIGNLTNELSDENNEEFFAIVNTVLG